MDIWRFFSGHTDHVLLDQRNFDLTHVTSPTLSCNSPLSLSLVLDVRYSSFLQPITANFFFQEPLIEFLK